MASPVGPQLLVRDFPGCLAVDACLSMYRLLSRLQRKLPDQSAFIAAWLNRYCKVGYVACGAPDCDARIQSSKLKSTVLQSPVFNPTVKLSHA
jgi:hypothetical protein